MNQREIKFRIRLKHSKTGEVEIDYVTIDELLNRNGSYWGMLWSVLSKDEYIGLKDKTGKDIYEGDIVKWSDGSEGKSYEYWRYCEIVWEKSHFALIGYSADKDGSHRIPVDFKFGAFIYEYDGALEVIGNVYENTNLLNATTR